MSTELPPAMPVVPEVIPLPAAATLRQALEEHQAGRLPEAEKLYQTVLLIQPENPQAHHNLGILDWQIGKPESGLQHLQVAWETDPSQTPYWLSFIQALIRSGRLEQAGQVLTAGRKHGLTGADVDRLELALAESVCSRTATNAETHNSIGTVPQEFGRLDEALTHFKLGNALCVAKRWDEAVASYRRAVTIQPDYADAHFNLGNALTGLGHHVEAVASYRCAVQLQPDFAQAHNNLGNALRAVGQLNDALASYQQAVAVQPDYADAHNNLGNALRDLGQLQAAEASYDRALVIQPNHAEAHNNLANVLRDMGRPHDAVLSYQRALALKPNHANAHHNLGNALQDLGRLEEALAQFQRAVSIEPNRLEHRSNLLFLHAFTRVGSFQEEFREARQWEQVALSHAERQAARQRTFANPPRPGRPLRVGIVSAELGQHAVSYFLTSFLRALDRQRVRVLLYPTTLRPEAETQTLRALAEGWTPLMGRSDADAAAL
ncbi:MAG: tetratricopeptide repeat protein, partial [Pirellulaceae bacterium]